MPRKESEAVPEGNGPTPQDAYVMITWEELRRVLSRTWGGAFEECKEDLRRMDQRLASLEQNARQPRLAMEADVPGDKKTRERTEGAATAVQAEHGDSGSANKIDPDSKVLPASVMTSLSLRPSLVQGMMPWQATALRRQSRVPHLGDALTNSRRWLTPHGHNPYSDEDHLRPATSLVLPDRKVKFEDFNYIRLVLQHFWVDNNQQASFWPRAIKTISG